jgi:hypothetical protein
MKIEKEIKLSDVISWAIMLMVAGTIYGVSKVDMEFARRDIDSDHISIQKLNDGFYELAAAEKVLAVLVDEQKEREASSRMSRRVEEPK